MGLVDQVAVMRPSFACSIERGGGRLRAAEGLAWLKVAEGAGAVLETAAWLARDCPEGIARAAPPKRSPAAHVTVARRADRALVEALQTERWGPLRARWTFDRLVVMRSHLEPQGARYETLHEATLYAAGR
jgi:2'-5' RNA ligase